jgi:transposase InsO family protein
MDTESQRIYDRMTLHHLIETHPNWSLRQYAHKVGRDVRWVWKWEQRLTSAPKRHFSMYMSQSRAPKTRPRQTPDEVKDVIGDLREELSEKFHRSAGGDTILYALRQREDLRDQGYFVPTSSKTITRILQELGYIQKKKKRQRHPLQPEAPNVEWEMDFAELNFEDGMKLEFFLVVDRGTSRVIYLEGCEGYNAETSLEAVARLLVLHGLPERLRFDRDPRFVASWTMDSYPAALVRFLWCIGVEPIVCPPRRPDLKPFVERTVKTVKEEWFARFAPKTYGEAIELLDGFKSYFNTERPHQGRACGNLPPDEAFPSLPALPHIPETLNPNAWLRPYHGRIFRRRVSSSGMIQIDKHRYYIGIDYARLYVHVHLDADNKTFHITYENEVLIVCDIQGLHYDEMDFQSYLFVMTREARSIERHRYFMWHRVGDVD